MLLFVAGGANKTKKNQTNKNPPVILLELFFQISFETHSVFFFFRISKNTKLTARKMRRREWGSLSERDRESSEWGRLSLSLTHSLSLSLSLSPIKYSRVRAIGAAAGDGAPGGDFLHSSTALRRDITGVSLCFHPHGDSKMPGCRRLPLSHMCSANFLLWIVVGASVLEKAESQQGIPLSVWVRSGSATLCFTTPNSRNLFDLLHAAWPKCNFSVRSGVLWRFSHACGSEHQVDPRPLSL